MVQFVLRAILTGVALWVVTKLVPGIEFVGGATSFQRAGIVFVVALIFGVVNANFQVPGWTSLFLNGVIWDDDSSGMLGELERASHRFFAPATRDGHAMFDLAGYIGVRLTRAGIRHVEDVGLCTYADPARFFSYRRTTHRGEAD